MLNIRFYTLLIICLGIYHAGAAQEPVTPDSTRIDASGVVIDTTGQLPNADTVFATIRETAADTMPPKKKVFEPNAKKAGMYSSILPGLGQVYNRQYWKVPVVYAILGTAGYFIGFNYNNYATYRKAYIQEIDGDPETKSEFQQYGAQDLQRLQAGYRKNLDLIVLLTSVGYALQVMDAVASAHLRNFDISRDISMKVQPMIQNNFAGVGLVVNFK